MSDSLKEQLQRAGFVESKPKPRKKNTPDQRKKRSKNDNAKASYQAQQAEAERAKRKAQKLEITQLIDEHKIKEYKGESVYSYTLEKKIRQLFVNDTARAKLISGDWAITRLNGSTHLVPYDTGKAILAINPQWLVIAADDEQADDDGYNEFPVPDDLQW